MLAVILAAPFLGVDNFAVSVAVGLQVASRRTRALVAVVFGSLAMLAILLGSGLGSASASWLGPFAQYAGGAILVGLGIYQIWQQRQDTPHSPPRQLAVSAWSVLGLGLGVSLDTAVAGVAFGLRRDPILASGAIVGVVTGLMSAVGLELGGYVGRWSSRVGPRLAPGALVAVGLGIAMGLL